MQYVTVSQCVNQAEADMLVSRLQAAGFPVLLHSEFAAPTSGALQWRVQVPEDRAEDALTLLAAEEGGE